MPLMATRYVGSDRCFAYHSPLGQYPEDFSHLTFQGLSPQFWAIKHSLAKKNGCSRLVFLVAGRVGAGHCSGVGLFRGLSGRWVVGKCCCFVPLGCVVVSSLYFWWGCPAGVGTWSFRMNRVVNEFILRPCGALF